MCIVKHKIFLFFLQSAKFFCCLFIHLILSFFFCIFELYFEPLTTKHCIPRTHWAKVHRKLYLIVSLHFLFIQVFSSMIRCWIFIYSKHFSMTPVFQTPSSFFPHVYIGHTATFSPIMLRISIISHKPVYCTACYFCLPLISTIRQHISSLWKKNYCYLNFILSVRNEPKMVHTYIECMLRVVCMMCVSQHIKHGEAKQKPTICFTYKTNENSGKQRINVHICK